MGCSHSTDNAGGQNEPARVRNNGNQAGISPNTYQYPNSHSSSQADFTRQSRSPSLDEAGPRRIQSRVAAIQPNGRPNRRLRALSPVKCPKKRQYPQYSSPWTRPVLEQLRQEFWETRMGYGSGRQEYWDTLRAVCDLLREPTQESIDEAQNIMNAAGMTCPTGKVCTDRSQARAGQGVYDEFGARYEILPWHVVDPIDIIEDDGGHAEDEDKADGEDDKDDAPTNNPIANANADRNHAGAKLRARDLGDEYSVLCRFNDTGMSDVTFRFQEHETVAMMATRIRERFWMQADRKTLRLIYSGRLLKEDQSLLEQGWQIGTTLNVFITNDVAA